MRLQDYDTSTRVKATVASTERITPATTDEVREIVLDLPAGELQTDVGQSIGVLAPGQREFGQEHHLRLYTVADLPEQIDDGTRLRICVRRCNYIDEYNGEEYKGVASNYLCDLRPGDQVTLTGPYGLAFEVPAERDANLILIGAGTGIAPFRAFVKHLYHRARDFTGRIWLFHGARSGLDLLYRNELNNDLALYYDRDTFEAIEALSKRPHWSDAIDWSSALESRSSELASLLSNPKTYVYVAGLEPIRDELDAAFAKVHGSAKLWGRRKAELVAGQRWVELLY